MKRFIPIVIIITLLFVGCSKTTNKESNTQEEQTNSQTDKTIYIMAGKIASSEETDITSKIPVKVSEINVDIGSVVKEGEQLIKFDTQDMESQVRQAQAAVDTARANLLKVQSGARPEQIAQAQSALEAADTNYQNMQKNFERIKQLFEDGAISQQQLESAEQQYKTSEAQYNSAKQQLNMLNKGETRETIDVLESQVKQAEAALDYAKLQLDNNGAILSPISGVISTKNINAGETASPGVTLVSIVNSDQLYVNAYLPSEMIQDVKVEQEVVLKVSELPDKNFEGNISMISPIINESGKNILVKVKMKNPDPALKPGMFAEIGIKNLR